MRARPVAILPLVAASQAIHTAKGRIAIDRVGVGDHVLTGGSQWATVIEASRFMYNGPMVSLHMEGQIQPLRVTPTQLLAIGPDLWARAEQLGIGAVVASPIIKVPTPPMGDDSFVSWLDIVTVRRQHHLYLRSPWGLFAAKASSTGSYRPTMRGLYRSTPEGLVRLNRQDDQDLGNRECLPEVFYRVTRQQWDLDTAATSATQQVICHRAADRIEFSQKLIPGRYSCVALPRRIESYACGDYSGPAYTIAVAGASSMVVSGVLAQHGVRNEAKDTSVRHS